MGVKYEIVYKRNGYCEVPCSKRANNIFIALWYLLTIFIRYPIIDFTIRRGFVPCEKCKAVWCWRKGKNK